MADCDRVGLLGTASSSSVAGNHLICAVVTQIIGIIGSDLAAEVNIAIGLASWVEPGAMTAIGSSGEFYSGSCYRCTCVADNSF